MGRQGDSSTVEAADTESSPAFILPGSPRAPIRSPRQDRGFALTGEGRHVDHHMYMYAPAVRLHVSKKHRVLSAVSRSVRSADDALVFRSAAAMKITDR